MPWTVLMSWKIKQIQIHILSIFIIGTIWHHPLALDRSKKWISNYLIDHFFSTSKHLILRKMFSLHTKQGFCHDQIVKVQHWLGVFCKYWIQACSESVFNITCSRGKEISKLIQYTCLHSYHEISYLRAYKRLVSVTVVWMLVLKLE